MHSLDISSHAAHLHSGELVAVKVQRPGMTFSLTLDALLFHMIGGQLKRFAKARKDLLVAVNEMVSTSLLLYLPNCHASISMKVLMFLYVYGYIFYSRLVSSSFCSEQVVVPYWSSL